MWILLPRRIDKEPIIVTSTIISFSIAISFSFLVTTFYQPKEKAELSYFTNIENQNKQPIVEVSDAKGDVNLTGLYKSIAIPKTHGYHDILSTKISRIVNEGNKLLLTINLDGNPNQNEKYETAYLWILVHIDQLAKKNNVYTVIIPNFANDSNFENKGWYLAVYDNINNKYTLPLSNISQMPKDKVEVSIDPIFTENVPYYNYTPTAVMIRVNDTYLLKPPDFLVDTAPDGNSFWLQWFR